MRGWVGFSLIFFFFGQGAVSAQIVINEFSAKTSEWVELYNSGDHEVDLSGWFIKDAVGHEVILTGKIQSSGFSVFDTPWLNDSGDTIYLISPATESASTDSVEYGSVDHIYTPPTGKSAGRIPDGEPNWFSGLEISKGFPNPSIPPTPSITPTLIPTKTPVPTKTPAPTKTPSSSKTPSLVQASTHKPTTYNLQPTTNSKPTTYNPQPTTNSIPTTYNLQPTTNPNPASVLSASTSSPTPTSPHWGAVSMIILGVGMIGVSAFYFFKKTNSN